MKHLPHFKYNPNAYTNGIIEAKEIQCNVCKEHQSHVYKGPFYSVENIDLICPWCVANGQAAQKYEGEFQSYTSIEGISPDPKLPNTITYKKAEIDELILQTPSYTAWQQAVWLGHCESPCAFIDYVGWEEIKDLVVELKEDIEQIKIDYHITQGMFEKMLQNNGDFQGYLFQCIHCKKHRLTIDAS